MTQRLQAKLKLEALRGYALRVLSQRGLSVSELRRKLLLRAETPGDVDAVVDSFQSYGYLDDRRLSEGFADSRAQSGAIGEQRVLRDLLKKRIAPGVAREAVSRAFENVDEPALIREFLARKMRGKNLGEYLKEPKNLASLYRRLRTAGFSSSASIRVMKSYSAQAEDLESIESAEGEG
jgi:regulatory protein